MSAGQSSPPAAACPPTRDALRRQAHQRLDEIIAYCLSEPGPPSFLEFETALLGLLRSLGGLLIQLFLRAHHDRIDLAAWQARGYPMFGVNSPGSAAAARENTLFSRAIAREGTSPARKV